MSTLAIRQNYGFNPRWIDAGTSPEARFVAGLTQRAVNSLLRIDQRFPLDELDVIREETNTCASSRVASATLETSRLFVLALPNWVPIPEVAIDPDGEIAFDWFGKRGKNFSVSVRSDGRLSFAGQFGPKASLHGTEEFVDSVPKSILNAIGELFEEQAIRDDAA